MKKTLIILILVLIIFHGNVFAGGSESADVTDERRNTMTCIHLSKGHMTDATAEKNKTMLCIHLFAGYRFIDLNGAAEGTAEHEYPHNSIILGGEIRLNSSTNRLHFDVDFVNQKDYLVDISYAYKDTILLRGTNSTLYHNINNIKLIDLDTSTSSPGVDVRDADKDYGVKTGINSVFLRLKPLDFPFHVYVDGSLVEKKGTQQQRFMSGAAYFNDQVRASMSRDINWRTENIVIGANSHLGPVEIDISHGEKKFDARGDDVLFDSYSYSGFGPGGRQPGVYAHNLIPDTKSSSDTIKIHTSFTGRFVASATLSRIESENTSSEAESDYLIGSGNVTWMPMEKITFFLKYRYRDRDVDNPDSVTITDISNPLNSYTYEVKPSISSISSTISGTARYRPVKGLTLNAKYVYDDIRRKDTDEWELIPQRTIKNSASVSANLKIKKNIKLKTKYIHKYNNNPSTNIEPDRSDEGRISVSWMPVPKINTLLSYSITNEDRDELAFLDTEDAENRNVKKNSILGSITFMALKNTSVTASYAYSDNITKQDIEYHDNTGTPNIDQYIPYDATSHNYAVYITHVLYNNISLNAGLTHTISEGLFHPDDLNLTQPVSIASFSELETEETVYSISGEYMCKCGGGFSSGIEYIYSDFDDVLDNPYDDVEDGRAHMVILRLSREW